MTTSCLEEAVEEHHPPRRAITVADMRARGPLAGLSWLSGEWHAWDEESRRCTVELWMSPAGTSMLGGNRTVEEERTVGFEQLRIEARDGQVVYVALPSGQSETEFNLVDSGVDTHGADFALFENPEHDFPVRIRYSLEMGDLGREELTARAEGREPGNALEWRFRRMEWSPCPPPPSDLPPSE